VTRRITVVTSTHLATCPRMLKAADALHEGGYDVRLVSVCNTPWAAAADPQIHASRRWQWHVVEATRGAAPLRWLASGVRFRAARALAMRANGPVRRALAPYAVGRMHTELVSAILERPHDLIYAGTSGAIAAALDASRIGGAPCAIDFEDFHCGEQERGPQGAALDDMAATVMARASCRAAFLTAGSAAIADACDARFGRRPIPIHNVFPLPPTEPATTRSSGPLRLYWFSQTIGPYRGLEDVVAAAGRSGIECELHLRGVAIREYVGELEALVAADAPRLRLVFHHPESPERMVDLCRAFDVGIASEQGHIQNRALALANKALTYPLAGLAMLMTDTPGQRRLAADASEGAWTYSPGDVDRLAEGLSRWAASDDALRRAKEASWEAARQRWHWEHREERDALLNAVAGSV
jgi:glycosyltransferase involved in cell wall biosynthesis